MNLIFRLCTIFIPTLLFSCLSMGPAFALDPSEVMVIANMNASQSKGIAVYYMEKRQIPKENLVMLFITDKETCTRESYEKKVIPPIRRALAKNPDIRALLTLFGLPLRIASPGLTPEEQSKVNRVMAQKKKLENQLKGQKNSTRQKTDAELKRLNKRLAQLRQQTDKVASFDSELMLVKKKEYRLNMWLQNPYFLGWGGKKHPSRNPKFSWSAAWTGPHPVLSNGSLTTVWKRKKRGWPGTPILMPDGKNQKTKR